MFERNCLECAAPFEPHRSGKPQKYCSKKCRMQHYDRHPDDTKETPKDAVCEVCKTPFLKRKRHQKYCSALCYERSWIHQNPEEHKARGRMRRRTQPEWYREKEPRYTKTYRAKLLSSRPWGYLLLSARSRAKEKNLPFELTDDWARARWTGCCEITKIPFRVNGKAGPHPFSPSIDRMDASLGYTQANTRFILWGCNAIKGVGTDEDMRIIAKAITYNS